MSFTQRSAIRYTRKLLLKKKSPAALPFRCVQPVTLALGRSLMARSLFIGSSIVLATLAGLIGCSDEGGTGTPTGAGTPGSTSSVTSSSSAGGNGTSGSATGGAGGTGTGGQGGQ